MGMRQRHEKQGTVSKLILVLHCLCDGAGKEGYLSNT